MWIQCLFVGHTFYWLKTFNTPHGYVEAHACMQCGKVKFKMQGAK